MPRSWPNTEAELLEVELDLQFDAPASAGPPPAPFRLKPLHLVALLPALAIGLALVPQIDEAQPFLVPVETLPEPAVATTAAVLPSENQASLSGLTFELLPIDLGRITTLVGPATLNETSWLIGSVEKPGSGPLVFSSNDDGHTWQQTAEIATDGATVTVHDLESFAGSLVALGTTSDVIGPAAMLGSPDEIVIWQSSDGLRWADMTVVPNDGRNSHPMLDLTTDDRTILIGGRESEVGGEVLQGVIPEELTPAVTDGRLDLVVRSGINPRLSVIAPPGIEVFRSEAVDLPDRVRNVLYRSEDLQQWEGVDVEQNLIIAEMVVKPGGGFVVPSSSGDIYSAIDGRGWGRNLTIPPASYSRWGEWLVGLQSRRTTPRLVVGAGTRYSTVDQPLQSPLIWSGGGDLKGGPVGLVSVAPVYLGPAPAVSFTSGSQVLVLNNGMFSISPDGSNEASRILYQPTGEYDPTTDMVSIDLGAGKQVLIDLDDLQPLRAAAYGEWETTLYTSPDALRWSRSNVAFSTTDVDVLGAIPDGFLIMVGEVIGGERTVQLYRTGPVTPGVNG